MLECLAGNLRSAPDKAARMSDFTQFLFVVQGNVIKNVPFQLGKCIPKGNLHAHRVGNLWSNSCHDSLVVYIRAIGREFLSLL